MNVCPAIAKQVAHSSGETLPPTPPGEMPLLTPGGGRTCGAAQQGREIRIAQVENSGKIHETWGVNQPYPTIVGIEMDPLDYIHILYLLMDRLCAKNRGLHVFAPNLWQCLEGT